MTTIHGRDAYGRPISLLNDHQPPRSWESWSAESGSPDGFLPTPDLWRSSSCSSRQTIDDSSPTTPADGGGHSPASVVVLPTALHASLGVHPPLRPKQIKTEHPSMRGHHHHRSSAVMVSAKPSSPVPMSPNPNTDNHDTSMTTVSTKPMPKRYPCQFADTLDCREMFTTSGHASRHAKRHTGEKNVLCPRCPKRFARKDNMKQHLKTHEGGTTRSTTGGGGGMTSSTPSMTEDMSSPASSVSPSPPPSRAAIMRPPLRRSSATHHVPRRASPAQTATSVMMGCTSPDGMLSPMNFPSPPQHPSNMSSPAVMSSFPSPLCTPGLDALVIAADRLDHTRVIR